MGRKRHKSKRVTGSRFADIPICENQEICQEQKNTKLQCNMKVCLETSLLENLTKTANIL